MIVNCFYTMTIVLETLVRSKLAQPSQQRRFHTLNPLRSNILLEKLALQGLHVSENEFSRRKWQETSKPNHDTEKNAVSPFSSKVG